jgi:hypothetical protein
VEGSDYLLTCAEIGVALAGFSALVVAVHQRGTEPLSAMDRRLVALLIERGLMATFFSLLPVLLAGLNVPEKALWFSSSLLVAAYGLSMGWRSAASRWNDREAPDIVAPLPFYALLVVGLSVVFLQIIHALGFGIEQSVWWYLVAVTWLLTSAGYLFFFVIRGWMRSA